jgi:hypothetical protein
VGRIRVLRKPFPLLLGVAAAPGRHVAGVTAGLGRALTGAKADERVTCWDLLHTTPALYKTREGTQTLIADKGYYGAGFEADLTGVGITLLRPSRKGEKPHGGERFFKPLPQTIESIFDTLKAS